MKKKSGIFFTAFLLILSAGTLPASIDQSAVIFGDQVALRAAPGKKGAVRARLTTGVLVKVVNKTEKRDIIEKGDSFGYFWYKVVDSSGARGWIYGKFVYISGGDSFFASGSAEKKYNNCVMSLNGKSFIFRMFVEQAYPVSDASGLTGSTIHGLPVFLKKGTAFPLWGDRALIPEIKYRARGTSFWFRMEENDGLGEKLLSMEKILFEGKEAVKIAVNYSLQAGGGSFTIVAVLGKDRFVVRSYVLGEEKMF